VEIVVADNASALFARAGQSRQQQRCEHRNDGDHDQQLDQCECRPAAMQPVSPARGNTCASETHGEKYHVRFRFQSSNGAVGGSWCCRHSTAVAGRSALPGATGPVRHRARKGAPVAVVRYATKIGYRGRTPNLPKGPIDRANRQPRLDWPMQTVMG